MKLEILANVQQAQIEFNNEALKKRLAEKMADYKGAVISEEFIKIGKGEVASLRKLKTSIEARRKEVKAEFMVPYLNFENQVKELVALIDEPIELLSGQLNDFEEKRREAKKIRICQLYEQHVSTDLAEYIPIDKIYNDKWENATTSEKSIKEDLIAIATSTQQAIQTIKAFDSDYVDKALAQYKLSLDLPGAMSAIGKYEQQKAYILAQEQEKKKLDEEKQKQAEIERIREEERARIREEERIKQEERQKVMLEIQEQEAEKKRQLEIQEQEAGVQAKKVSFVIEATDAELEQIELYLNSIGVEFERAEM